VSMETILIIDDDFDIIEASSLVLESKGYKVIAANNPYTGFKLAKEKNPDLIILDVMMEEPDDGFFLAQKLKREGINVPILMYTSISKTVGIEYGANELVPVDDFVEKPISPEELLFKVERLLLKEINGSK